MENKTINIAVVSKVAKALKELLDKMVFVGGAVVSLYADDAGADDVRPTKDVDMTVDLAGFSEWAKMQERLAELGFSPDPAEKIISRYRYQDVLVDIMPADVSAIIPFDILYKEGFKYSQNEKLPDGTTIRLLPVTYFLATKFSAFHDRATDPRTSKDFEDIIYVTDNCTYLQEEIRQADEKVKNYLKQEYEKLWNDKHRDELIGCHLSPVVSDSRLPLIKEKIESIIK